MKKKKSTQVSLGDIARVAGVSKATTCYVLRNRPGPSSQTREHVLRVARQLDYVPDPRVASWMACIRDAKDKDLFPIAWVDTNWEKNSWEIYKFLTPYLEGARAHALQLGYRIEQIWAGQPGMTMRRVSQIVDQRGIEGVIATHHVSHMRLNWDKLACVALEGAMLAPRLHRVMTDYTFNLLLALKMVKRYGYRRIGICLEQVVGRGSYNMCRAAAYYFHATLPKAEIVPPLFYQKKGQDEAQIRKHFTSWLRQHRPDVVVGHHNRLVNWVEGAGYRVPEEIGVVHIATDDDVTDWAGVCSKKREIGAAAVGWVISHLQNRQFGVPETAMNIAIRGTWHNGRTLLVPKPK